jgi:hypothetical protein
VWESACAILRGGSIVFNALAQARSPRRWRVLIKPPSSADEGSAATGRCGLYRAPGLTGGEHARKYIVSRYVLWAALVETLCPDFGPPLKPADGGGLSERPQRLRQDQSPP